MDMERREQRTKFSIVQPISLGGYRDRTFWYDEPYEGRLSRTVLWEGGGEIPPRLPGVLKKEAALVKIPALTKPPYAQTKNHPSPPSKHKPLAAKNQHSKPHPCLCCMFEIPLDPTYYINV